MTSNGFSPLPLQLRRMKLMFNYLSVKIIEKYGQIKSNINSTSIN
jgi:hypothetical protein